MNLLLLASLLAPAHAAGPVNDAADAAVAGAVSAVGATDSSGWDGVVEPILLGTYDLDHSGEIDTPSEVAAIGCPVWAVVDGGVKKFYSSGVWAVYGFGEGYGWVGDALGFSESVRVQAASAIAACGYGGVALTPVDDDDEDEQSDADVDDQIKAELLGAYDANGSGAIEKKEAKAIPCDVLRRVDALVREAWDGTGVRIIHGFEKDMIWVGYALGFADSTRGFVRGRFEKCGVAR